MDRQSLGAGNSLKMKRKRRKNRDMWVLFKECQNDRSWSGRGIRREENKMSKEK